MILGLKIKNAESDNSFKTFLANYQALAFAGCANIQELANKFSNERRVLGLTDAAKEYLGFIHCVDIFKVPSDY